MGTSTSNERKSSIAIHGLSAFFRAKGIVNPDGRPLFAYAASDSELDSLLWYVRAHDTFAYSDADCGALVLILSNWMRRRATTLERFWEEAIGGLGLSVSDERAYFDRYLENGLAYWQRSDGVGPRCWVVTLVAEGGFPESMLVTGLGALLEKLISTFSWTFLAAANGREQHTVKIRREVARLRGDLAFGEFSSELVSPAVIGLLTNFAVYRQSLTSAARPGQAETIGEWLLRIPAEERPQFCFPYVEGRDAMFSSLLFSRLRSGARTGGHPRNQTRATRV